MARRSKNDTEILILNSAKEEFLSKGFDGARTTSIADAAGVTHAMLHYYYRTKEQLFERVFEDIFGELLQNMVDVFCTKSDEVSLRDKLRMATERHFDFVSKDPRLPLFVVHEIYMNEKRSESLKTMVAKIAEKVSENFAEELKTAIQQGDIAPISFIDLLFDIVSLNVFSTIAASKICEPMHIDKELFLKHRREENVLIIMKRLEK